MLSPQDGQLKRLQYLLSNSPSSVDARCPSSGDTPLIAAAREGHEDVVQLLLKYRVDVTIQNEADETALDVASDAIKKIILSKVLVLAMLLSVTQCWCLFLH